MTSFRKGQGLLEYALILIGVLIVVLLVLNLFGVSLRDLYCQVAGGLGAAQCQFVPGCQMTFDSAEDLGNFEGKNPQRFIQDGSQACLVGNGTTADSFYNTECGSNLQSDDYQIYLGDATITREINNNKNIGLDLWFRSDGSRNGYLYTYNARNNRMRFWKVVQGRWIKLSEAKVPGEWSEEVFDLTINVQGDTYTVFRNETKVLEAVDSGYPSGFVGLRNKPSSRSCIGSMEISELP